MLTSGRHMGLSEVAGVTFSGSASARVPKFLNPVLDPGPENF